MIKRTWLGEEHELEQGMLMETAARFLRVSTETLQHLAPSGHPCFLHLVRAGHYARLNEADGVLGAVACAHAAYGGVEEGRKALGRALYGQGD